MVKQGVKLAELSNSLIRKSGGRDGTRTRGLLRDRQTL